MRGAVHARGLGELNMAIAKQSKSRTVKPHVPDATVKPQNVGANKATDNFDILPHDHKDKPDSEPLIGRRRELHDHERGIGPGVKLHAKRMPQQAAPDHGDHYE
jgi:hypothetical protein